MALTPKASGMSSQPAGFMRAVTPHASNDFPAGPARGLYIGGAGDVSVVAIYDSDPVVLKGVAAGTTLPIRTRAVRVTGTTATNIVALY